MAIYLSRKEYVSTVYYYDMLVDSVMAQHYADYINNHYVLEHDGPIVLTEQDIINAWEGSWEDGILDVHVVRNVDYESDFYYNKLTVGDILKDLLNDDMWEQDYDQGDTSTESVEDYITKSQDPRN